MVYKPLNSSGWSKARLRVQELCENRSSRPRLSVLMSREQRYIKAINNNTFAGWGRG